MCSNKLQHRLIYIPSFRPFHFMDFCNRRKERLTGQRDPLTLNICIHDRPQLPKYPSYFSATLYTTGESERKGRKTELNRKIFSRKKTVSLHGHGIGKRERIERKSDREENVWRQAVEHYYYHYYYHYRHNNNAERG